MKHVEILLVEDSPTDRLLAIEALQSARIANTLHTVEDGREAMEFLQRRGKYAGAPRPDLILLDLNLPRKDGREVLAEIKSDAELRIIPVVVLTTSVAEADVLKAYGLHANAYVQKPLNFERFAGVIGQIEGFWFDVVTLPTRASAHAVAAGSTATADRLPPAAPPPIRRDKLQLLLVEDNPTDALVIEEAIAQSALRDAAVTVVPRLNDMRRHLAELAFDAVLLDLNLPDSYGLETVRRARAAAGDLPVILLTGLNDEQVGAQAVREGAQDYLPKGEITPGTLGRAIRYAIDRVQIETQLRQAQRLEAVGQLAGGIAHDFNNILTVIGAHATFLGMPQPACPPEESVHQIAENTKRAANLVRQLLTFSRRQILQPREINLNEVVGGIMKMLGRVLGENYRFELHLAPELPPVHADIGMLEQIIMNLVVNARDALPEGGKIALTTEVAEFRPEKLPSREAYAGRFVRLAVSDNGTGIAPEVIGRIFDPFFTTKEQGKGTGLGLSTVYGIVKQHRGWVDVVSTPGKGAMFSIYLPEFKRTGESAAPWTPAPATSSARSGGARRTILVVEDEPALRLVAEGALEMQGYRVLTAASGTQALSLWSAQTENIDLLFTDMVMPEGINGRELARRLQELKPDLKVLYTSGYGAEAIAGELKLAAGANFLPKPYDLHTLFATIEAAFAPATGRHL